MRILFALVLLSSCGNYNSLVLKKTVQDYSEIAPTRNASYENDRLAEYSRTEIVTGNVFDTSGISKLEVDQQKPLLENRSDGIEVHPKTTLIRKSLPITETAHPIPHGSKMTSKEDQPESINGLAFVGLAISVISVLSFLTYFLVGVELVLLIFLVTAFVGHILGAVEMGLTIGRPEKKRSFKLGMSALIIGVLALVGWLVYLGIELG